MPDVKHPHCLWCTKQEATNTLRGDPICTQCLASDTQEQLLLRMACLRRLMLRNPALPDAAVRTWLRELEDGPIPEPREDEGTVVELVGEARGVRVLIEKDDWQELRKLFAAKRD